VGKEEGSRYERHEGCKKEGEEVMKIKLFACAFLTAVSAFAAEGEWFTDWFVEWAWLEGNPHRVKKLLPIRFL